MAITISLHPSGRFVVLHYGETEPAPLETQEAILRVLADPQTPPHAGLLIDRRAITQAPGADRVRQLTTSMGRQTELFRGRRVAVVFGGDMATLGLLRMAQTLSAGTPSTLEGFTNVEEAITWLTQTDE